MGVTGAGGKAFQGTANDALSDSSSSGVLPSWIQGAAAPPTADAQPFGSNLRGAASGLASRTGLLKAEAKASEIQRLISEESAAIYKLQWEANARAMALQQQLRIEAAAFHGGSYTGNFSLLPTVGPSLPSALGPWQQFLGPAPLPVYQPFPVGLLDGGALGGYSARSHSLGSAFEFLETSGKPVVDLQERLQGSSRWFKPQQQVNHTLGSNKRKAEEAALPASVGEQQQKPIFGCAVCRVDAASQEGLDEHMRSEMHRTAEVALKMKKLKTEQGGNGSAGGGDSFYCHICDVTTSGEQPFKEHCRGKKHKAAQAKVELACPKDEKMGGVSAGVTHSASTPTSAAVLPEGPASGLGTIHEGNMKTEEIVGCGVDSKGNGVGNPLFFCSLCKLSTTSEEQLREHCRGKKHATKLLSSAEGTGGQRGEMEAKPIKGNSVCGGSEAAGGGDGCNSTGMRTWVTQVKAEPACLKDEEMGGVKIARSEDEGMGGGRLITHCASTISSEDVLLERPAPDTGHGGNTATDVDSKGSGVGHPLLFFCAVCNLSTTSEEQLKQHCQGKKHKAKLLVAETAGGQLGEAAKPVPGFSVDGGCGASGGGDSGNSTTDATIFFCSVCKIFTHCQKDLETHKLGKKHRVKSAATTSAVGVFSTITCPGNEQLVLHLDSAKHKADEKVGPAIQAGEPMMKQQQVVVEELKQQLRSNVVDGGS